MQYERTRERIFVKSDCFLTLWDKYNQYHRTQARPKASTRHNPVVEISIKSDFSDIKIHEDNEQIAEPKTEYTISSGMLTTLKIQKKHGTWNDNKAFQSFLLKKYPNTFLSRNSTHLGFQPSNWLYQNGNYIRSLD